MPYVMQRVIALVAVVVLGPLILALAVAVRLTSRGPAFHRATRVRPGGTFTLLKLRTMDVGAAEAGPGITAAGDRRVTRLGRLLRRTKLDELPQLWNVVRGDMALVGPRPEDPRYVDLSDPLHATVFGALPGITGPTALAYRDEERLLADAANAIARTDGRQGATAKDLERAYRESVLPAKLGMDAGYLSSRSLIGDVRVLVATLPLGRRVRATPPAGSR
jgi:lipopolysaccharide/colanic/teichoic acid biosynthesis glycosyltransferase